MSLSSIRLLFTIGFLILLSGLSWPMRTEASEPMSSAASSALSAAQLRQEARVKALNEAQAFLDDTTHPKELAAVKSLLDRAGGELRSSELPRGARAWCPSLNLSLTGYPRQPNPLSLVMCFNDKYNRKEMNWEMAMKDEPASLRVAGVWWSGKQQQVVPVTVITQATIDRLPQLYYQCKSWKGPLSAVLYMALYQAPGSGGGGGSAGASGAADFGGGGSGRPEAEELGLSPENVDMLSKAANAIADFFSDVEKEDDKACKLDVMLVYEVYTEQRAMMLYPINALRNAARLQARTPLLALVDVDMLLSASLYEDLRSTPGFAQQLIDEAGGKMSYDRRTTAFVLPAFETTGPTAEAAAVADLLASRDKRFLSSAVRSKGLAGPFDQQRFPQGHNWTLFERWYRTTEQYTVNYGYRYEPWTIVDRTVAPWHDSRFRGYGQNKIVHVAHMNASGFKFTVLQKAFIVHRAHQHTTARLGLVASKTIYDTAAATRQVGQLEDLEDSVYGHTKMLFDEAVEQMGRGAYEPFVDEATLSCIAELSWVRGAFGTGGGGGEAAGGEVTAAATAAVEVSGSGESAAVQ